MTQKAKLNQPFAFYTSTINMHFPGFKSSSCKAFANRYTKSVVCTDDELGKFLRWIMAQDFYKNTSVVILGDHLSQVRKYFKNSNIGVTDRKIFNLF
ncbi:MAG: sulfatase-like hydrolase/transferase [Campylobacter sp.]|nr:sulfatase-like hydrolase/transferase [Campylobacter sp.]